MTDARAKPRARASKWGAIRKAFAEYFATWGIRLPRSLAAGRGHIDARGWSIDWLVGSRRGKPYLDFGASHRMTNPRHHRIHASGDVVWLPAERDMFMFSSGSTDAEAAARQARYERQNDRVATLLRKKFAIIEAALPDDPGAR